VWVVKLGIGMKLGVGITSVILTTAMTIGCPPDPRCPDRRDDAPAPNESSLGSDCHRAGLRLQTLGCKQFRPDWDDFCESSMKENVPLCPVKLSHINSCDEISTICR
jgi:hypothetical protein